MHPTQHPAFLQAHAGLDRLTDQQAKVMDYLIAHLLQNHCLPSIQDISITFGYSSSNAAHSMLKLLQSKGYLEPADSEQGKARASTLRFARLQIQFAPAIARAE